ncbi:heavy-metal-associated domain-containing protein [Sulfobacillus thermosulfidooxidans]|uniref:heavy-metal-associated domain-containing protein n=1 Tax=Sulfobacillus thermosulfidooxidans TaxID=28034 RepID=UPI0006B4C9BC|nr:heavy metal-associated domain-containing protein [Sulfobacillus thermosulfidooxidans]
MVKVQTFLIIGEEKLHCVSCEARVGNALKRIAGVHEVTANHQTQKIEVTFSLKETSEEVIQNRLEALGYQVKPEVSS